MTISKLEWEVLKRRYGNKCPICGRREQTVGGLIKAHLKAASRGGTQYFPLCANCHKRFDAGKMTERDLAKIGLRPEDYRKVRPATKSKKRKPFEEPFGWLR